jgi:hypothetical protein
MDQHLVAVFAAALGAGAHVAQQLQDRRHVLQLRHVVQQHRLRAKQRGAQLRQRRVLGAGNLHLAFQGSATANEKFVHGLGLPLA